MSEHKPAELIVEEGYQSDRFWNYHPPVPLKFSPLADFKHGLGAFVKHFVGIWHPLGTPIWYLGLAFIVFYFFTPSLERTATFAWDWVFEIWLRDIVLVSLVAGGSHLYLHTFKKQGTYKRYDKRELDQDSKRFHFNSQLLDNVFWTLTTGVGFMVFWEALLLWAYANGFAPMTTFAENPFWFVLLLILTPYWTYIYFDIQHRIMHTKYLYKYVHCWHHRNTNTGPWSGLAMHPIEHFVLMSDTLIFFLIKAHPIHVIYDLLFHGLGAPLSHTGYERIRLFKGIELRVGDFYHQLHHRFVETNHGTLDTPFDKWMGTWHDGTMEGNKAFRKRRMQKIQDSSA